MRLQDKVALVTGANSGIGRAIAERFAAEGAHVAVNFRTGRGHEDEVAQMIAKFSAAGMGAPADVSKRDDVERMIGDIVRKFGRLDIVVNNAGLEIQKAFLDITDDDWNK